MAEFYKILKADPLGEPYQAHGKSIQTYWCQFEGVDNAVSVGKQSGNVPQVGSHVYGDLMYAKSQKGTEYWKFKGSKVPDGVKRPTDDAAPAPILGDDMPAWFAPVYNMVEYMYKEFKNMNGDGDTKLEDQNLDDIFGDSEPEEG